MFCRTNSIVFKIKVFVKIIPWGAIGCIGTPKKYYF